jgi:hypothetical protein
MGKRNRERRATKEKQRRRTTAGGGRPRQQPGPDRAQVIEGLVIALSAASVLQGRGKPPNCWSGTAVSSANSTLPPTS